MKLHVYKSSRSVLVEGSFNEAGLKLHICTAKQINQRTKECTTTSTSFLASGKYTHLIFIRYPHISKVSFATLLSLLLLPYLLKFRHIYGICENVSFVHAHGIINCSRSRLGHLGHVLARGVTGSLHAAGPTGKRGAVCI